MKAKCIFSQNKICCYTYLLVARVENAAGKKSTKALEWKAWQLLTLNLWLYET